MSMNNTKNDSKKHRIDKFAKQLKRIKDKKAIEDDSLAFIHKFLVTGAFPHSNPKSNFYSVINGHHVIWVQGGQRMGKEIGVPYGTLPRLLSAWVCTECVKTGSAKIKLGKSLTHFLNELDLNRNGGKRGDITRLKKQLERFVKCRIGWERYKEDEEKIARPGEDFRIAKKYEFWDFKNPDQTEIFGAYIELDTDFFEGLKKRPIPLDMIALKALKSSALALDLYMWLTYRVSYLNKPTSLSWDQVMNQVGAEYKHKHRFAQKAKKHLKVIKRLWKDLNYKTPRGRLYLDPSSKPHIPKKYRV